MPRETTMPSWRRWPIYSRPTFLVGCERHNRSCVKWSKRHTDTTRYTISFCWSGVLRSGAVSWDTQATFSTETTPFEGDPSLFIGRGCVYHVCGTSKLPHQIAD